MAMKRTPPATTTSKEVVLAARHVSKYYGEERGRERVLVLDDITLDLRGGEFIALLGPSGSGKSTLLRILAGLVAPSSGEVLVHDQPLVGANQQVAIVFQGFALYPWLTVLQNVEIGLLDKEMPPQARRERALQAIDLIGLDGFESAYPRELSGGMKQRVGFARALVVEPEVLFLDEPFSALDVLVAENLRHELLDLWQARKIPTRAILMVTHNIDEAVQMADRLLVFGANPGRIRVELPGLAQGLAREGLAGDGQQRQGQGKQELPQSKKQARAQQQTQLVDTVYRIMTNPKEDVSALVPVIPGARPQQPPPPPQPYQALPHVGIDAMAGFIERLHALEDREDLYELARDLQMEADDILPLAQAANLLGFADLEAGDVVLTPVGRRFAEADILEEKAIFRQQAVVSIYLLRQIMRDLEAASEHRLEESGLLEALQQSFSEPEARRQLDTAIDWGGYAELFAYDDDAGEFFLEEEVPAATGTTQVS